MMISEEDTICFNCGKIILAGVNFKISILNMEIYCMECEKERK